MPDILYVHNRRASFIELDRELLAERWKLEDWYQPRPLANPVGVIRAVRRNRLVFCWWASWHALLPITAARLLGRRSVLVVGGFDLARLPEIEYGHQRGGVRRWISRAAMRQATRLMTNSQFSRREAAENAQLDPDRVTVVYHGVPDPFGSLPEAPREPMALCVGHVDRRNLARKGQRPFVEAAARLPEVQFVLAGPWDDDAADELASIATANVRLTGRVSQDELNALFRSAAVYVQASRHEGFGISVAEAMLAGCIPVVTSSGALPEVVGDAGILLDSDGPDAVARGVAAALELGTDAREAARRRVLEHFPIEVRRRGLHALAEEALAAS